MGNHPISQFVWTLTFLGKILHWWKEGHLYVQAYWESKTQLTKCQHACVWLFPLSNERVLRRPCSRTPHITFQNLKALSQFHTLSHLARYPSSAAFLRISPETRLKSAAKGHGGPALPLSSPDAPAEETRGGCLSGRPMAQFHSEWHAASRLYEMEPHNQIEKPQCRTV